MSRPPAFGYSKPGEGKTNDWCTPPAIVERLGQFTLDPCAAGIHQLARQEYRLPQDGLSLPWFGRVWCNPPYGPHVGQWVKRLAAHGNGTLLIFSRTETRAWEQVWSTGDAFLFPFGRISFLTTEGKPGTSGAAPSVFVAYGAYNVHMLQLSGIAGAFLTKAKILTGAKVPTL